MQKMNVKIILFLGLLVLFIAQCQPGQTTPTPPPGVAATFSTGTFFYQCATGEPLALAFQGTASSVVTAQFTSVSAPQFNQSFVYGFQDSDITSITAGGCANIRVPEEGEYTAVIRYVEGNSNCQPSSNQCWRWYTMQTLPDGFVPACTVQQQIFINQDDPNGFTGDCM